MVSPLNLLFLLLIVGEHVKEKGQSIERKIEDIRVIPLIVQGDTVITNLDALIECEIYRDLGYEVGCRWDDEVKVKLYSVLLFLRKRFEKLIGIEDEIAKSMINDKMKRKSKSKEGTWNNTSEITSKKNKTSRDKKKDNKDEKDDVMPEMFREIGLSEHHIRREEMKIRIFISKVKKNFLVDIEDLKSIIEEKFLRNSNGGKDKVKNKKERNIARNKKIKQKKIVGERIYKHKKKGSERDVKENDQEDIIRREMEEIEEKITQEFINLLIPPDTKFYFE